MSLLNIETSANQNIIQSYFSAFNSGDRAKMLSLLHPEVEHEINQGKIEAGTQAFSKFMNHMDECYQEQLTDMTIFSSQTDLVAAEYKVAGTYLKTDGSLPEAKGQKYIISAGSFFRIQDGKIKRVTTYYNLPLWIKMVSGEQ